MNVLIENNADVNAIRMDRWSALHCAASEGHVEIARVLIENGAAIMMVLSKRLHCVAVWKPC